MPSALDTVRAITPGKSSSEGISLRGRGLDQLSQHQSIVPGIPLLQYLECQSSVYGISLLQCFKSRLSYLLFCCLKALPSAQDTIRAITPGKSPSEGILLRGRGLDQLSQHQSIVFGISFLQCLEYQSTMYGISLLQCFKPRLSYLLFYCLKALPSALDKVRAITPGKSSPVGILLRGRGHDQLSQLLAPVKPLPSRLGCHFCRWNLLRGRGHDKLSQYLSIVFGISFLQCIKYQSSAVGISLLQCFKTWPPYLLFCCLKALPYAPDTYRAITPGKPSSEGTLLRGRGHDQLSQHLSMCTSCPPLSVSRLCLPLRTRSEPSPQVVSFLLGVR